MTTSRNSILSKLRQGVENQTESPVELDRCEISTQDWSTDEMITRFTERMVAVRAQVHETSRSQRQETLEKLCKEKGVNNLLLNINSGWGAEIKSQEQSTASLPKLIQYEKDVDEWKNELFQDIDASLTSTIGAIAETGTIVIWPTIEEPRTLSLIPPIHFAVLEASKLYSTFAEIMREQSWSKNMPTNALLISGPSKSADIEQTLAFGVHGPKELIVLLITD